MTITVNGGNTTSYIKGWDIQNPYLYATPYTVQNGNTVITYINECTISVVTSSGATINNNIGSNQTILNYTNNTPAICDATTFPNVITLANGTGSITITTPNGQAIGSFTCSLGASYTSSYLSAYATGSMAKSMHDLVVNAVGSRTAPDPSFMNVYSSGYTINPNLYTKNIIDLTPYSENSPSGNGWPIVLISPRHVMYATHVYTALIGSTHTFTDKNGNQQTKTVTGSMEIGRDITISYFDSNVTGITPYSVLPDFEIAKTKIPIGTANNIPGDPYRPYGTLVTGIYGFYVKRRHPFGGGDYIRQMQLGGTSAITGAGNNTYFGDLAQAGSLNNIITDSRDIRYPYNQWATITDKDDSSSPAFLPTGLTTATGTPLTIYLGSTTLSINSVSRNISAINAAMNAIKAVGDTTTYALDQINVSQSAWWNSFNTY